MFFENAYFIIGTSYAGKSTMVRELAAKHHGIECGENYHDNYAGELDAGEFPCLTYTRDLEDWHDFIRRSPQEYKDWIDGAKRECEILEEPDPEKAMENYRQGLELICSQESYDELLHSGFSVIHRDENRTIEETLALAEKAFGLV
ncbi:MAG: AAA family ATPase [Lachnospiraceae bacterium]|nr:AAA family ATPase [Lachnospiraceae bacterium]